jgi:hypothetical protein
MSLEVRIQGAATFHEVAARMRAEGRRDLSRSMGQAMSKAADPVKVRVREEAVRTMPKGGGYSGLFSKSLKFRTEKRQGGQSATVRLITFADGKKERRDIRALEGGRLRHPVWGHRSSPWAVTGIRPGFHRRGTEHAMDEAQKQLAAVVDDYARRLAG